MKECSKFGNLENAESVEGVTGQNTEQRNERKRRTHLMDERTKRRKKIERATNEIIAQEITEKVIETINHRMSYFQPSFNGKAEIYNTVLGILENGVTV